MSLPRLFAKRKAELDEEIQAHLQMDIQNRKDRGASPKQARAEAVVKATTVMVERT